MSAPTTNGTDRHAAAAAYRESITDGVPLTGAQLAGAFGRSDSWGRGVIREARGLAVAATPEVAHERQPAVVERHDDGTSALAATTEAAPPGEPRVSWVDSAVTLAVALARLFHLFGVAEVGKDAKRAFP